MRMTNKDIILEETIIVQAMVDFEGYPVEEAVLTAKSREKLPSTAFCGPKRTYPAHDAKHVRNALTRLSQFGGKLKPATRLSIFRCLSGKAKKMGISITDSVRKKLGRSVSETVEEQIVDWYLTEHYPELVKKYGDK